MRQWERWSDVPFLGLIDLQGLEIVAAGYHRIDMSNFPFKVSPPNDPSVHFIFVNLTLIQWPIAKEKWQDVSGCCVFSEVDDEKPTIVRMFPGPPKQVSVDETVGMGPGQLKLDLTVTPNERRNYKPQRCPKCGAEIEQ